VTGRHDLCSPSFCSSPQEKRTASPYITDPPCQPNFSHLDGIIRHNEIVVNIFEGEISGQKGRRKTSTTIFKQVARNTGAGLQQWKEWLAIIPDGKLPINQNIER